MQCGKLTITDSIFTSLQNENEKPVSGLLPVKFVSPQFVCIVILQHKSEWMDSLTELKVKTSVCRINLDGSSAKVTLFSSRKIFLFWKVFGWLSKCFGTKSGLHTSSVATGALLSLASPNKAPTRKIEI